MNWTTAAAAAAPSTCITMYGTTSAAGHLPRRNTASVTAGL
jgi:hypothetical protein